MICSATKVDFLSFEYPSLDWRARVPALDGDVHLWHGEPQQHPDAIAQMARVLSEDERSRMSRFRFQRDQNDFAFARAMLRNVLASYLGTDGKSVRFTYSERGKPALAEPWTGSELRFNLSHTRGAVLLAVCAGREIGVDVEYVREDFEIEDIAGSFFSAGEREALMKIASGRPRAEAFFRCWTRKEAWIKARGDGLSFPLKSFDVSIAAEDDEVALVTRPRANEAQGWCIRNVPVARAYAAAAAVSRLV
ncbi:MAG TPA: 4'-phosphopantetheinyl transferase superfamily protein [Terriglobales bacterium]|nr:4'-phosphopantetheinyl transferase superfamily protein [Terriglobales bacterium]